MARVIKILKYFRLITEKYTLLSKTYIPSYVVILSAYRHLFNWIFFMKLNCGPMVFCWWIGKDMRVNCCFCVLEFPEGGDDNYEEYHSNGLRAVKWIL